MVVGSLHVVAEGRPYVDGFEDLDADAGGQRDVEQEVADVQSPRHRQ
jgi:hypothetical protein